MSEENKIVFNVTNEDIFNKDLSKDFSKDLSEEVSNEVSSEVSEEKYVRPVNNENTTGLFDELSDDDNLKVLEIFENLLKENDIENIDKNLDEDILKVPNQKYAVISYVGPMFTAKTEIPGFRILGVFPDTESAIDHITNIHSTKEGRMFDTGIVEMNKFILSYPFLDKDTTQKKVDTYLNNIIVKYKKKLLLDKIKYDYRKDKLLSNEGRFTEEEMPDQFKDKDVRDIHNEIVEKEKESKNEEKEIENARDPVHARLIKKFNEKMKKKLEIENSGKLTGSLNNGLFKLKCGNLRFVAITYVKDVYKPESTDRIAIKIKGAFATEAEAKQYIEDCDDQNFDIVVSEMYGWIPCNPDYSSVENEYNDNQLNILHKAHKSEAAKAGIMMKKNEDPLSDIVEIPYDSKQVESLQKIYSQATNETPKELSNESPKELSNETPKELSNETPKELSNKSKVDLNAQMNYNRSHLQHNFGH